QRGPAQDERTQEDLAQLGVGLYESADTLRGELEDSRGPPGAGAHHDRTSGKKIHVSREPAWLVHRHDEVLTRTDLDPALDDDEERAVPIALCPEALPVGEDALLGERRDPRKLRRRQRWKHLIAVRLRSDLVSHSSASLFSSIRDHRDTSPALVPPRYPCRFRFHAS